MCPSKPSVEIVCKNCSTAFLVTPQRKDTARFCSNACQAANATQKATITKTCQFCRTDFQTLKGRGGQRKYCSPFCTTQSKVVRNTHVLDCAHCGETFVFHCNNQARRNQRFCSVKCFKRHEHGHNPDIPKHVPVGHIDKDGYKRLSVNGTHISEHRYVFSKFLGRDLLPHENVHHLNGDRTDNRLCNLELWSKSQPAGQRIRDKLAHAKMIISLYEGYINPNDIDS